MKITAHKGGRVNRKQILLTDEALQQFRDILAQTGESQSDFVTRMIATEWDRLFAGQIPFPPEAYKEIKLFANSAKSV
jgi:hypothetical protein